MKFGTVRQFFYYSKRVQKEKIDCAAYAYTHLDCSLLGDKQQFIKYDFSFQ